MLRNTVRMSPRPFACLPVSLGTASQVCLSSVYVLWSRFGQPMIH